MLFTAHKGRESCATQVEPDTLKNGRLFDVNSFN